VVEWDNPGTLGRLPEGSRFLAGAFHAVNTRTAGFNSVPTGELRTESLLASDVLMFIGGGSAGTAGGIKVTTFALLAYVIWAELRGDRRVAAWSRGVPAASQRQAVTVALLGVGAVVSGTWCLLAMSGLSLDVLLFEATSAFGTVGLSTGATSELPAAGHVLLAALMFIGRLGPLTMGAALTLRSRPRSFEFPEERPIVG
jgi:trk system potassium uptake protein TrkH